MGPGQLHVNCSNDPIGFHGSTFNLFEWVDSQPTKYIDPLGLFRDATGRPRPRHGGTGQGGRKVRQYLARDMVIRLGELGLKPYSGRSRRSGQEVS